MKIMRLLSSLQDDEAERGIFKLSRVLIQQGHQSMVITSAASDDDLVVKLVRDGNLYHQLPIHKNSWVSLLYIWRLYRLIKSYQPDIIHVHSRTPAWLLMWALKLIPKSQQPKLIATIYGFYPLNLYSQAIFQVDYLITVSDSVTNYICEHQLFSASRMTRIYRGVNKQKFVYRHNPSVYWLRRTFAEFPELEHKKWLLFPTTIGQGKGQEWLFDIVGNLREAFPKIHIIIMDDDSNNSLYFEEFIQRMHALNLNSYFTFIGRRNDNREWLAASNVVLGLANLPESIGIHVLQAIHLGTSVVGWDKGAYSEILHLLYPQGLVKQQQAKSLCKVIKSQLLNVSRPAITDTFTLGDMIQQTIDLYEKILD